MASKSFATIVTISLIGGAFSQAPPPFNLCTTQECDNCPTSVTSAGTGYPACVVYNRDDVLGGFASDYETAAGGKKNIYFDITEQTDPTCRTIVRSPANVDDENCGAPVYIGKGGVCTELATDNTFMVQFCCGDGDCSAAGAKKRSANTYTGAILQDADGNHIIPNAVGHLGFDLMEDLLEDLGLNGTSHAKRDCDAYNPDGAPYTKTADNSIALGGQICGDGSKQSVTNENSVSQSTTFGTSVSDPFGIISASIEFSFEESASQSYTYEFTPPADQCGHVTWTPILRCTKGTITGCSGGDQTGEACTADRISDQQLNGAYRFTVTDG